MTAIAHRPAFFERRGDHTEHSPMRAQMALCDDVWIRASEDGWSLLDSRGVVLFRGLGLKSQRQCLDFARDIGMRVVRN